MVSLFSLSQRRTPALIALWAILMLFIAPEVSKTLAHWRASGTSMPPVNAGALPHAAAARDTAMSGMSHTAAGHNDTMGEMPQGTRSTARTPVATTDVAAMAHHGMMMAHDRPMAAYAAPADPLHPSTAPGPMATMDDLACGYCELLVHLPLIVLMFLPLVWLLFTSSLAPAIHPVVRFYPGFLPGIAQPRGPPRCPSCRP